MPGGCNQYNRYLCAVDLTACATTIQKVIQCRPVKEVSMRIAKNVCMGDGREMPISCPVRKGRLALSASDLR